MLKRNSLSGVKGAVILMAFTIAASVVHGQEANDGRSEEKLTPGELPKAIVSSIEKQFPGAKIEAVTLVQETQYELEFETSAGELELTFYPDGREILSNEGGGRGFGGFGGFGGGGFEEEIPWEDLPKEIQEALAEFTAFVEFESVEREDQDGIISFSARSRGDLGTTRVRVSEAGEVIEFMSPVDKKAIPAPIVKTMKEEFPEVDLEGATKSQETYFKVKLTTESGEVQRSYAADGSVAREEE